jgi:hypothetical protein
MLNLSGVQASAAGVSSSNLQLKNKATTVKPQSTNSQAPSRSASNQLRPDVAGAGMGPKTHMQTFSRQQNRRRPSKNLNETQGSVLSNYNNTALAGYTTGNQNNQNADHLPDRLSQFGGRASHNNSTDDGNAGGSFFPGPNPISQQYSEQRSQQLSRGSKRAHHNKVGRRSQTTHEQSHAE